MRNKFFLSRLAGVLILLVFMMQNAMAGGRQTPYQQLQEILDEYHINKKAVIDELTVTEIKCISADVAVQFKVPEYVVGRSETVGEMLTNILKYKYAGKRGAEWDWRKIQYSSKNEDYALYMLCYPTSKHVAEAYSKFLVIQLHEAFVNLVEANLITEACHEYLDLYQVYSSFYETYILKVNCLGLGIHLDYEGFSYINPDEWAEAVMKYLREKEGERQVWKSALRENMHNAYWN